MNIRVKAIVKHAGKRTMREWEWETLIVVILFHRFWKKFQGWNRFRSSRKWNRKKCLFISSSVSIFTFCLNNFCCEGRSSRSMRSSWRNFSKKSIGFVPLKTLSSFIYANLWTGEEMKIYSRSIWFGLLNLMYLMSDMAATGGTIRHCVKSTIDSGNW